mgnify:FL=1|jgi:hypothetical protein|tara:strand:+ start:804 stop:1367 length:564 start_codon:yes stop_codon:yes gene_type:complete
MISSAIESVVQELDNFLRIKFQLTDSGAILSNLANVDGSIAAKDKNKVVVTLVGIQEDKLAHNKLNPGKRAGQSPPVYLNIHLLISANFDEKLTKESLRFISAVVAFFQSKSVFLPSNTPSLSSSIEKLVFEIVNLEFQAQSSLFTSLGAKYLPSVLYKMRMLAIDEGNMLYTAGRVKGKGLDTSQE